MNEETRQTSERIVLVSSQRWLSSVSFVSRPRKEGKGVGTYLSKVDLTFFTTLVPVPRTELVPFCTEFDRSDGIVRSDLFEGLHGLVVCFSSMGV